MVSIQVTGNLDKVNSPFLTVGRLHIFISDMCAFGACHVSRIQESGQSGFLHRSN